MSKKEARHRKCPKCGHVSLLNGTNELIQNLPFFDVNVTLATRRIITCPDCGYEDMIEEVKPASKHDKSDDGISLPHDWMHHRQAG